jgi:hypothetical protein
MYTTSRSRHPIPEPPLAAGEGEDRATTTLAGDVHRPPLSPPDPPRPPAASMSASRKAPPQFLRAPSPFRRGAKGTCRLRRLLDGACRRQDLPLRETSAQGIAESWMLKSDKYAGQ